VEEAAVSDEELTAITYSFRGRKWSFKDLQYHQCLSRAVTLHSIWVPTKPTKRFGEVLNEQVNNLYSILRAFNYNITYFLLKAKGGRFRGDQRHGPTEQNKQLNFLIPAYRSFDWALLVLRKNILPNSTQPQVFRFDQRKIGIDALYLDDQGYDIRYQATQKFKAGNLMFSNYSASPD